VSLQTAFQFSPVLASATVGFVGSFYHFSSWIEKRGIHAVIYAGSFAGMCSQEYLSGHQYIIFISVVGSALYLFTKPHLNGFGGKMGAIAFVSSLILILSRNLW
ncbi:MAG: hypothetical protein H0V66_14240, partial [Bdellovibrionales bacterium]|nr:hypothetical protein [Bdellovibrionales bacterium]